MSEEKGTPIFEELVSKAREHILAARREAVAERLEKDISKLSAKLGEQFGRAFASWLSFALRGAPDRREPPKGAEFLIAVLAKPTTAEALLGDLNERFNKDFDELGHARAKRRYWARVIRSLLPLLRRALGRAMKWGVVSSRR